MHKEQLEYFALAYQMRSFSAAAARVPMSPQGLAKSIHALELELGVTLFTTDINGARVPTPEADELMEFANTFELNYQMLKESFRRIQACEKHEIRLGTSLGTIGLMGPDFLDTFHMRHPEISVTYNELSDALCDEGLRRGTYDFTLTISPYPREFITTELYATQICYWLNTENPLSNREVLTYEDLAECNVAIPGKDFKCYDRLLAEFRQRHLDPHEIVTSQEIFWLYEFALDGHGAGFTLASLAELPMFSQHVSVVAIPLEGATWHFGVSYLPSHSLAPHERIFYDHCIEWAREVLNVPAKRSVPERFRLGGEERG